MKKEIGKYIAIFLGIVCIILITVLIYIKSTNVSSDTASKNLKSKTLEEIRYLDRPGQDELWRLVRQLEEE